MTNEEHIEGQEPSLTDQFKADRYDEITPENWLALQEEGLDSKFFNNLHGKLPLGFQRIGYIKRRDEMKVDSVHKPMRETGMYQDRHFVGKDAYSELRGTLSETKFYEAVDAAIEEVAQGRETELLTETNPINRMGKITKTPYEQLSDEDKQFFADYMALYKILRNKGFSHQDLTQ